jgi:hypothetical protein
MILDHRDIGCYIHTALRKACDSTPTSLVYNLIHASDGEWSLYLKYLTKFLDENKEEMVDQTIGVRYLCAIDTLSDLIGDYYPTNEELKGDGINASLYMSIALGFKLFDDRDWQGALCYIVEDEKK